MGLTVRHVSKSFGTKKAGDSIHGVLPDRNACPDSIR